MAPKSDGPQPPDDLQLLKAHWHVMRGVLLATQAPGVSIEMVQQSAHMVLRTIREPGYEDGRADPPHLRIVE